jgi:hypothetical protein
MKNDGENTKKDGQNDSVNTEKKQKSHGKRFLKGHKFGVRFGEGQTREGNGRPLGGMSIMKQAMRLYEDNALKAAEFLLSKAFDPNMDPKMQFPWFKELNGRILGATKGSAEDIINKLSETIEGALSLSRPALEATAMKDAEGLVRELDRQGILEQVVDKVRGEEGE